MYVIDSNVSKRITYLRFPLIVLVILIHNNFSTVAALGTTIHLQGPPEVELIRQVVSGIFATVAVPLLFLISGILLYRKEVPFLEVLKKKSKTLLVPLVLWNLLWIVFYLVSHLVSRNLFQTISFEGYSWVDWIDLFLGRLTGRSIWPLVYPLWFIRDLYVLSVAFLVIKFLVDRFPLVTLAAMTLLWLSNLPAPVVQYQALLFFSLGYYVVKYNLRIETLDAVPQAPLLVFFLATILLQVSFPDLFPSIARINTFLGCLVVLRFSKTMVRWWPKGRFLEYAAGLSFFLYALHEPMLTYFRIVWVRFLPSQGHGLLLEYFGLVLVVVVVGLLVGAGVRRWAPPVYRILTGER